MTRDEILTNLKKLKTQLRREATLYRKKIGNDQTHYEGTNKGLWLAYEASANKIQQLINKMSLKIKKEPTFAIDPVFLSDNQFVDTYNSLNDGIEYVVGKWYFWDETWAGAYGPFNTEVEARKKLVEYAASLSGNGGKK